MRIHVIRCVRFFTVLSILLFSFYLYHSHSPQERSRLPHEQKGDVDLANHLYISYEDHLLIAEDAKRTGLGEQGQPVHFTGEEANYSRRFKDQHGFNTHVSSMLALDRSIKDVRHPVCKRLLYPSRLPLTSIIIAVFQEEWNALFRTVFTSIKRAPAHLIKEVILVDDGSTIPELKEKLDNFISRNFSSDFVRVIHSPKREGLIIARNRGAMAATGDVLVFLDSHCEAGYNWLPPLLDPIMRNYRTVVCPSIDIINASTFEYEGRDGTRGGFDWDLSFKRFGRVFKAVIYPWKPFNNPVMAGGLFAISARWFKELGHYDPGLVIWGGEQYELSFKVWMCWGNMVDVPCSRFGHIYRKFKMSLFPNLFSEIGDFLSRNYKRVAEVWMDEYAEYVYNRHPRYRRLSVEDLSERKAIRQRLGCRPFKWYMENVAFDVLTHYPLMKPIPVAFGFIRSMSDQYMCLEADRRFLSTIHLSKCTKTEDGHDGSTQNFEFTYMDELIPMKQTDCLDVSGTAPESPISLYPCHRQKENQRWKLIRLSSSGPNVVQIRHPKSDMCMTDDLSTHSVLMMPCDAPDSVTASQLWEWGTLQLEKAERVNIGFDL